jgi:UDP-2,4-diacetamido-2,4,6-trideoxy-beta-L-altropyranose hydrolase
MKIVFRVDASVHMGSGHLMRCLTLAQELSERGVHVRFICGDQIGNLNDWLINKGTAVTVLTKVTGNDVAMDAAQTISALRSERHDWMVVDHYGLDIEWEQLVRPFVERILVIDDHTGRSHDCDVLLDQNFVSEGKQLYNELVPDDCQMLLGPNFALLRKEFGELRHKVNRRQSLEKVLVFFTAGNDQGETLKAMRGVEMFGLVKRVDVVVGYSNPHNNEIKSKCDELDWGFHCQVDYMPTLISKAEVVPATGNVVHLVYPHWLRYSLITRPRSPKTWTVQAW